MSRIPVVSIALPVFNGARTLPLALQSILQQSFKEWELIVLDDGSTDESLFIAKNCIDPRIRVVADGRNVGLPSRLNQAIDLARGRFFARMDADDVAFPQRLERQVEYLLHDKSTDLLGTGALVFRADGEVCGQFPFRSAHAEICARPWAGFYLPHPSWMGRIEWFRKYRYRTSAVRAEDQDLLLRSYERSKFAALPDVLLGYRQDSVQLRAVLTGRYSLTKAILKHLANNGRYDLLVLSFIEQCAKGLTDAIVCAAGARGAFYAIRTRAIDNAKLVEEWGRVWRSVNQPAR